VAALQSTITRTSSTSLKIGYNRANTEINGFAPIVNGSTSPRSHQHHGQRGQHRHRRQGSNSGVAIPGGLLRQNSANNGRGAPYEPYSLSVMDSVSWLRGAHF
jgi:hypothetical protein